METCEEKSAKIPERDAGQGEALVLVVDDVEDTVEMVRRHLIAEGYRVESALSVIEALEILRVTSVDLLITDLMMPGGNGIRLLEFARRRLEQTAVMVMTGYPAVEELERARELGVFECLVKPFTEAELLEAVRQTLERTGRNGGTHGKE
jgi:two-component system response regulator HydG